jgi:hypothetical protein
LLARLQLQNLQYRTARSPPSGMGEHMAAGHFRAPKTFLTDGRQLITDD